MITNTKGNTAVSPRSGIDRLLSLEETRRRLGGISRATLWRLTRRGRLRGVKIGGRRLFLESDVQNFIVGLTAERP